MGTTINGVYKGGKSHRRLGALKRLTAQLKVLEDKVEKSKKDKSEASLSSVYASISRINKEIASLELKLKLN